ncbi:hypothetical protein [Terasakiella sp. SH-1]|uniref:hypothetical protein n=1 Tax=Terasakiella sp. SH-1 TaxID=2560057 RepID=UPI0010747DCA|nr:hypothetical protein [Terasakiella sp. SH-1]
MGDRRNYRDTQTLQPGQIWRVSEGGRHFIVLSADGPFEQGFGGERRIQSENKSKRSPEGGFDEFEIKNIHTAPNTITVLCTDDDYYDGRTLLDDLEIKRGTTAKGRKVTVSSVPTLISSGAGRFSLVLKPKNNAEIFIGESDVDTTTKGYPISSEFVLDQSKSDIYGIAATGTVDVYVLEEF